MCGFTFSTADLVGMVILGFAVLIMFYVFAKILILLWQEEIAEDLDYVCYRIKELFRGNHND